MNAFDILGSLMQSGMGPAADRLSKTFGNHGFGGQTGFPGAAPGGTSGLGGGQGTMLDMLGKMAGAMMGGGNPGGAPGGLPLDMLKTIGGAIFGNQAGSGGMGGFGGAGPAAAGAGAMGIFAALAAQALQAAQQAMGGAGAPGATPAGGNIAEILAGLRKPASEQETQQVLDVAQLTIRAMINAAKADGRIDEQEAQRLLGKMQEDGVTEEERAFVMAEIQKPMETDAIVRAVPSQQVAAQIYTASLMAIEVDTDAERRYLQELASKLGLQAPAISYLHGAVGLG